MKKNEHEQARDAYLNEIERQMIGPFEREETIQIPPWDLYHAGILSPAGRKVKLEDYDEERQEDSFSSDGFMDLANAAAQGALGFTCYVRKGTDKIELQVSWAKYIEVESNKAWKRVPFVEPFEINKSTYESSGTLYTSDGVVINLKSKDLGDCYALTVSFVNSSTKTKVFGEGNVYQASMTLVVKDGLIPAPVRDNIANTDEEFWQHELIYRDNAHYATGHGCAVQWDGSNPKQLITTWMPRSVVRKASPDIKELANTKALEMKFLGNFPKNEVLNELELVPQLYAKWIEEQKDSIHDALLSFSGKRREKMEAVALSNLENCKVQCQRMREGITLLRDDTSGSAFEAFQLANLTIRKNIEMSTLKKGKEFNFEPSWRPFQLAFMLLALPSSINENHPDRDVMELIWFPTGGGKTEAYLGLTAILFFHRYLTADSAEAAAGTAVITRYTLRLLTIQQFERAALMICAANKIKSGVDKLQGYKDFDIGLFVGGNAVPNKLKEVPAVLNSDGSSDKTTLPLKRCPACGSALTTQHQALKNNKLITWCSGDSCDYNSLEKPLPLIIIDEQLYDTPPTFVIGTVDKFANMPFTPQMGRLLGRGTAANPLQLIIQDELHLISDTLGTVTALYETAIDYVTQQSGSKVKIVGSTATIRRAETQTLKLFNRRSAQFPSPGLHADDSFFYQSDMDNPGRLYVGLHAQGRSPKHTLSRLAANCLQATEYTEEKVRDNFHTLVMYFNSMRELGGSLLLLEDDIPKYMKAMEVDDNVKRRTISKFSELTSKLTSDEVPEILEELDVSWPTKSNDTREPIDAVLSTNMISVGVDVSRLGTMIVNGQPKNTSEYIQASSRVGRDTGTAGIVFTLYNWTRSRDRSHYEKFHTYHSSFYRHVESSSVTPFASRARDRALRSVLISMARLTIPEFESNSSPNKILDPDIKGKVRALMAIIVDRAGAIEPDEKEITKTDLEDILYDWQETAECIQDLKWQAQHKKDEGNFLIKSREFGVDPWEMQRSVRDVENQVTVSMYIRDTE